VSRAGETRKSILRLFMPSALRAGWQVIEATEAIGEHQIPTGPQVITGRYPPSGTTFHEVPCTFAIYRVAQLG